MLTHIRVQNIALIDEADIDLEEGLNVLTGETGAGKSILLGAINLALGARSSKDTVRDPSRAAEVALLFTDYKPEVVRLLEEMGIEAPDGELLIRRRFSGTRSTCMINQSMATTAQVRQLASLLIDVHGQHEHQSLLNVASHIDLLDRFISRIPVELGVMGELYSDHQKLRKELDHFQESGRDRQRLMSLMAYELSEISETAWKKGEEEQLVEERKRLIYSEKLQEESRKAYELIGGSGREASALDQLDEALSAIHHIETYDPEFFGPYSQTLADSISLLRDTAREFRDYAERTEADPERLAQLEDRYDQIQRIQKKYGATVEQVEAYRKKTEKEYKDLENLDETIRRLEEGISRKEKELRRQADLLTSLRKEAAGIIEKEITDVLKTLEFTDPVFQIQIEPSKITSKGQDKVTFMIRTNVGEAIKPLSQIASGGEMSRVMLAIKTVLAKQDEIGTLIFDEIDTGISGRTAQSVAEKMAMIGLYHQVICVTHLPQIAAMADAHLRIEKQTSDGHTVTQIGKLGEKETEDELARMLGGAKITGAVRENAAEMKALARAFKQEQGVQGD